MSRESSSEIKANGAESDPRAADMSTGTSRTRRGPLLHSMGLDRFSALYLGAGFVLIFGLLNPDTFLSATTVRLVLTEGVVVAILALAFLIPLTAGVYDLSVGANLSLALLLTNWLAMRGTDPALAAAMAVVTGGVVGLVSGFIVVRLQVNSFIATLGVSQVVTALILLISKAQQITGAFSESYKSWGRREIAGVPITVLYLLILALIIWIVLEYTPAGRYLFATGGNPEAARLAGVPTNRVVWSSLVASGLVAGLAGVVFSMRVGTFAINVGPGYLFPAIAAVFLGASQLSRRPNVWGTLIAFYVLAFGIKGLQLQFLTGGYWIEPLFQGVTLIFAVALAQRKTMSTR